MKRNMKKVIPVICALGLFLACSLTVFAGSKEQTDIVVYDRLENAAEDRQGIENFDNVLLLFDGRKKF